MKGAQRAPFLLFGERPCWLGGAGGPLLAVALCGGPGGLVFLDDGFDGGEKGSWHSDEAFVGLRRPERLVFCGGVFV